MSHSFIRVAAPVAVAVTALVSAPRAQQPSFSSGAKTVAVYATVTNAQGSPGGSVVVDVKYDYSLITPLDKILGIVSGGKVGPTLKFDSKADMRLE